MRRVTIDPNAPRLMAPDLRELRYFVLLAEELHFGRAAERLYLSQSALSHSISKLELKLDCKLFRRGKGGVTLTDGGRQLADEARRVLASAERFTSAALAMRDGPSDSLTVGYVPSIQHTVAAAIRRFTIDTGVPIDHQRCSHPGTVHGVESGSVDIGVVVSASLPDALPVQLETVHYKSLRLEAVVDSSHALAGRKVVELADLEPYPVAYVHPTGRELWRKLFALHGLKPKLTVIRDPITSAPLNLEESAPSAVWLQTSEWASADGLTVMELEPAVGVSFDIMFQASCERPEVLAFVQHLQGSDATSRREKLVAV
jgi:DNA-binding transcriptional LysR family regulator